LLYLDTSFVAPFVLEESTSAAIEPFITALPAAETAISAWTLVEFSSLLAQAVRIRRFGEDAARAAAAEFDRRVDESFAVIVPDADDYALARDYLATIDTRLRAPDAFHLAVAANRRAEAIYTLDKGMLHAGRVLGLPVGTGIDLPGYDP